ncbi:MAG: hypothetical protein HY593_04270 [Candidatus Omnitrophica bacterium]|nr:hypothetical protein [Candidatus Omnitrophota bacterium]
MKWTSVVFLLVFFLVLPAAAGAAAVEVKTRAIPGQAAVGDEVKYFIQIDRPEDFSFNPAALNVSLSPFEVKRIEVLPPVRGGGRVRETCVLALTIFQLGEHVIPSFPVPFTDASGRNGQILTEPFPIRVVLSQAHPKEEDRIRPIKGPVSLDLGGLRSLLPGFLVLLLLLFLVSKIVWRRLKKGKIDPESLKPPHERAYLELERLMKKRLLEAAKTKEFYSELSDILRRYLQRRFGAPALDLTTDEILRRLKEEKLDSEAAGKVRGVLGNADLVKFAKLVPPNALAERMAGELRAVVEMTTLKEGNAVR